MIGNASGRRMGVAGFGAGGLAALAREERQ